MAGTNRLRVSIAFDGPPKSIGELAARDGRIYFAYDSDWLRTGMAIAPDLPLRDGLFEARREPFGGLHGIFADSLPDGWGRLLLDRTVRQAGITPETLTPLDRLAFVGHRAMGALTYEPDRSPDAGTGSVNLDALARDAEQVYTGETVEGLATLLKLGGSPGGARPKVLLGLSPDGERIVHGVDDLPSGYTAVIVKFPAPYDDPSIGAIEAAYADMARTAGIDMPTTRLLPAERGPGYFAVEQFDRIGKAKRHMATFAGLFHADHRLPSVDYVDLLKGTGWLTRDRRAVDQHFRRMVFNVLAHNRDDHTKNQGYLMDRDGQWTLAPAYDLTPSFGPGGEHALSIAGEGRQLGRADVRGVADAVGFAHGTADRVVEEVASAIARWAEFASRHALDATSTASVATLHERVAARFDLPSGRA